MKLFRKEKLPNGRRHIYFCGIKIASYKKHYEKKELLIHGFNNKIINPQKNCNCIIYGNNNMVVFGKNVNWSGNIFIGLPDTDANNCIINIGDNATSEGTDMRICEDNTKIKIGSGCMFSSLIFIWASDTHAITDKDGNITNIGKYIKIGNRVWVGMGATILKNTIIADNCIIGTKSVVGGKFTKSNCVIAGNPGKIVKKDIDWNRLRPNKYILNAQK